MILKRQNSPLFPTPGAPITATFTSDNEDFFLRTPFEFITKTEHNHRSSNKKIKINFNKQRIIRLCLRTINRWNNNGDGVLALIIQVNSKYILQRGISI